MTPSIYPIIAASSSVTSLLGSPPRFFPFGQAGQTPVRPYAVWQQVSGSPLNYISGVPDQDMFTIQIDVYANDAAPVRSIAAALRDAIEPVAHIVGWDGESYEETTKTYRYTFSVDWFESR